MRGCILHGTKFCPAGLWMTDLRGAQLVDCDATGACFAQARLDGTRFENVKLDGVCLVGFHPLGTDLRGAIFERVSMRYVNLRNCDLRGLDLRSVYLHDARLEGALLDGAMLPDGFRLVNGKQGLMGQQPIPSWMQV